MEAYLILVEGADRHALCIWNALCIWIIRIEGNMMQIWRHFVTHAKQSCHTGVMSHVPNRHVTHTRTCITFPHGRAWKRIFVYTKGWKCRFIYAYIHTYIHIYIYMCVWERVCVCIHVCIYTHKYMRLCACVCICAYTFTHTYMYICVYICMYIYVHIYIYIYIYIYIFIYV